MSHVVYVSLSLHVTCGVCESVTACHVLGSCLAHKHIDKGLPEVVKVLRKKANNLSIMNSSHM